jgi:mycothiol S-conjugate amidase
MDDQPLCLLTVHAHPDDESSKGAGTVAKYHAEGVRTVLVCCTGGEEGEILNPAMDKPEVRENLHGVRLAELERAAEVIGYDEVVMLGYRDSGMPDTEANANPESFAQAPMEEAVGRLVAILRRERPQVIITYNEDQQGYPHPDHIKVHDISVAAVEAAADPGAYPDLGDPWQVAKTYYSVWSRKRIEQTHHKMLELGIESPFDEKWFERPSFDHLITTQIEISDYGDVRRQALLAHATQIDPESPFWFGLPPEVARTVHPYDDYVLGRSTVPIDPPEDDLFAGVRQPAAK